MTALKKASEKPWEQDSEREDYIIEDVREGIDFYEIKFGGGMSIGLSKEYGVVPSEGDEMTMWGGRFRAVRGMMINDQLAYYRTAEEEREHHLLQMYGGDAAEWLRRWDAGKTVWTIRMGGLSAGYDQCINILTAEMVRALLDMKPAEADITRGSYTLSDAVQERVSSALWLLGSSGAQYGAALNLALDLYQNGPRAVIGKYPEERHVQASKHFPSLQEYTLADRIRKAIKSYETDPATTDFQRGHLAALKTLAEEGGVDLAE